MYPNLGSDSIRPSAPPLPSPSSSLSNSSLSKPIGFSSLMSQPNPNTGNQSSQLPYPVDQSMPAAFPGSQFSQPPYPGGQSSQNPFPGGQSSQNPFPGGQSSQNPFPGGQSSQPIHSGGQSAQSSYPTGPNSSSSHTNPYAANTLQNANNFGSYSLPQTGRQPPPPQGGNPYSANPYQSMNPSSGYSQPPGGGQQPPRPSTTGFPNSYPASNPYQSQPNNPMNQNPYQQSNPYGQQQGNTGYNNPYQPQQGGYPPQQQQQQQPFQNPYGSFNPQQPAGMYGGYPPYNQPPPPPYQNPHAYQPSAGGSNTNTYGSSPAMNDRIRAIAGRHEINDQLAQRLSILQQFEIVVVCDDSGSMNTPVDGTTKTRWDELRSIVQIVIEIATVFDSNGVDIHFLNRPPITNVTDPRQVAESFTQRPGGVTPLTPALRRIFQSPAGKPGNDKRLLVFVATDGAPTDAHGNVDIQGLENLMRHERQANTTYVTFLACTDDDSSVSYLSQWDSTMMNVDVIDDYKTEREQVQRIRGFNYPFSFGDYVVKALLGAVDPQMDMLDESGNNNNNFRRF